jgi:hypothetical protein
VVVTKAYEAVPVITVRQESKTKSEDWAKLKGELTKAKGEATANNEVVFRGAEPQVIAYETSDAKLIVGSFSPGDVRLDLKRRLVTAEPSGAPRPDDLGAKAAGGDVAFAVISSPSYTAQDFGDLTEAAASSSLVSELFQATGAKPLETGLENLAKLTTDSFVGARSKLVDALKAKKPRAFVLYYVGHAVSGQAGAEYLVMGDYQGTLTKDLQQTSPFVPQGVADGPLAGSNIKDIMKVVAAAGQELAESKPGLVAVADIHRELTQAGVPFALVVDGCFGAVAMTNLLRELRFTPWGDYYGLGDGATRELQKYQQALRTYGEAPYLRSDNPVIFAARPGTLAHPVRHPFYESDLVPSVGPLAAKFLGCYLFSLENREDLTLGAWLRRITDFTGTGEVAVKGSISWSKFDTLGAVPMVSFGPDAKR